MTCKRICFLLTFIDGVLFRTRNFIPDYRYTQNFVKASSIDELFLIDLSTTSAGKQNFFRLVEKFASECFVPITAGGALFSFDEVKAAFSAGADKICLGRGLIYNLDLAEKVAECYGRQSVVASLDVLREGDVYKIFDKTNMRLLDTKALDHAGSLRRVGVGEILINSVERDGTVEGYDLDFFSQVRSMVDVPILLSGGCGNWVQMGQALDAGADAIVTSNIYHFTEIAIRSAKSYLDAKGYEVRFI